MEPFGKLSHDALKNIILSCLLSFFTGFVYSFGVFSTSVEAAASPPGSLDGVWASGKALVSAFCTPAMFFTGLYLSHKDCGSDNGQCSTKSRRGRIVVFLGSLLYGMLAIGGYGVATSSPILIRLSLVSAGAGFGLIFLQAMELLAAWVPHRPGLAVGIGQLTYGLGAITASSIFNFLLLNYPTPNALYISAAIMSSSTLATAPFISWPSQTQGSHRSRESDPLIQQTIPLSLKELVYLPSFWMYSFTIFSLRAGMAFVAYYFNIGNTFGKDLSELVTSFEVATIAGTLSRPLTGALVDFLKTTEGFFSLGSKNVILLLLVVQAISFLTLVPVTANRSYDGFAFFAGVIQTIYAAGTCCIPLLAREQFGALNSIVVFGTGGSISAGLGEICAVWMMAIVESYSKKEDTPATYQPYYVISFVWSVCGLVTCLMLKAHWRGIWSRVKSIESAKIHDGTVPSETCK